MHVPVLTLTMTPKTKADRGRLAAGLSALTAEDATLSVHTNTEASEAVVGGVGELQLEIVCDRLAREFGVEMIVDEPEVIYRVTVAHPTDGEMKYYRQSDGRDQYAHVKLHLLPGVPGAGYVFENKTSGGAIPAKFIKSIDEGIREAFVDVAVAGHPLPDVRVELYDGSFHEVDSSETAFRIAGLIAFQDASSKATGVTLEPIMRVEVTVPKEPATLGWVAGTLIGRGRAQMQSSEDRGSTVILKARVPLAKMLGYGADLRTRTQGRATYTMHLGRYEPISGGSDSDGDRDSNVRAPLRPRPNPRSSAIGLPEPAPISERH